MEFRAAGCLLRGSDVVAVTKCPGSPPIRTVDGSQSVAPGWCLEGDAVVKGIRVIRFRNIVVLATGFALALPAVAFDVAEVSMKELSDGSIIEFESSFCEVVVGDTVPVMLTGDDGDAATAEIVAVSVKTHNGATPNRGRKKGGERTADVSGVIGPDGRTIDVTLDAADEDWHTVHARIELSTGDKLGVNLHSMPCEEDDEEEEEEDEAEVLQ